MDLDKVLEIKVGGEIFVDYKELHPFQGKLKSITEEKFHDLVASLEKSGLPKAFDIWIDSKGKKWVHDGHHRLLAFKSMEGNGWFIPPIPCNIVIAKNKKEAAQLLLISNSTYAHMTQESLSDFMIENELQIADLEFLDLPDLDMEDFDLDNSDENEQTIDPDVEFSYELEEKNNYIIIYFSKDESFKKACEKFNVKQAKCILSTNQENDKMTSIGIGRLVNGDDLIDQVIINE